LTTLALAIVSIAIPIPNSILLDWSDFIVWWSDSINLDADLSVSVAQLATSPVSSAPVTIITQHWRLFPLRLWLNL
jgi:hypothetical protein